MLISSDLIFEKKLLWKKNMQRKFLHHLYEHVEQISMDF